MDGFNPWLKFAVAALATWRITHLLANEDGPGDVIVSIRVRLSRRVGQLMDCFQCLSLWIAAPMAPFVTRDLTSMALSWLALSGAACLLERLGQGQLAVHPIESSLEPNETEHELLRQKESGSHGEPPTETRSA